MPFNEPLLVRGARHARISFDMSAPRGAELIVRHLRAERLLAEECRPLDVGASGLEIKTHPNASHILCILRSGNLPIEGVRFNVDCRQRIEPIGRHFIVIGAMKAGTTSLFQLLAQHPALCRTRSEVPGVSFTKEINYFRKLYRKRNTPLHYDWRFPFDPARHAYTLDVSPGYAKWPGSRAVPARIASLGGRVKLAYILRHPVDRIESQLAQHLRTGEETTMRHCIRISRYAMQLDRFTAHFARDDILLLDFEELRRNPDAVITQICRFLDIETFRCRSKIIHNRRGIDFRLDPAQRAELTEAVRPDVQRLIDIYGFKPAETWLQSVP